jgi:chromate transporter
VILALSSVFLGGDPAAWVLGAAGGAGAAVPAIAVNAAWDLAPPSWRRAGVSRGSRARWITYAALGAAAAALVGPYLVLVLAACGLAESLVRRPSFGDAEHRSNRGLVAMLVPGAASTGGIAALAWTALKVGALSYGGGFVIIPLMRSDAVTHHHWMTAAQFLDAVALGQITPGPVVQTVAVVGFAAGGLAGGLLAALIAFAPSFVFVLGGGRHFDRIRKSRAIGSFLAGAGPAAIGAIGGSAIPLALSLSAPWQLPILGCALAWLLVRRTGIIAVLLLAGLVGVIAIAAGASLP